MENENLFFLKNYWTKVKTHLGWKAKLDKESLKLAQIKPVFIWFQYHGKELFW